MGFFDKMLNALGFEDEGNSNNKPNEKKEEKEVKVKMVAVNPKFDLKNFDEEEKDEKEEQFYSPKSQTDVENIANNLIKGENAKVNFMNFSENDRMRALDFLSGVLFVLDGKIEKFDLTTYIFKNKDK